MAQGRRAFGSTSSVNLDVRKCTMSLVTLDGFPWRQLFEMGRGRVPPGTPVGWGRGVGLVRGLGPWRSCNTSQSPEGAVRLGLPFRTALLRTELGSSAPAPEGCSFKLGCLRLETALGEGFS